VRRDSSSSRAVFRLATLLAWDGGLDPAIRLFRHHVRLEPSDDDGRVALARTLAWSGRYDQSMATYDSVLARNAGHRDAALGAAQALAWDGELDAAIGRYERWISDHPDDADAWAGLARAWEWSGRLLAARAALGRALAARPDHDEASAQLRAVDAALASSFEPTITMSNDSDHNRSTVYVLEGGFPTPWGGRIIGGPSYRAADLASARGAALTVRAATNWAVPGGRWTLRGEVGGTRLDGRAAPGSPRRTRTEPIVSARLAGRPARRISLGVGATRAAFDETAALIIAGIATTTVEGDAEWSLFPRFALSAGGGVTRLTGGSEANRRDAVSGALRWTLARGLSGAATVRSFGYARSTTDGYFAPKRYLLAEGGIRAALGGELGWGIDLDLGLGHQAITAFDASRAGRVAQRARASIAYRPAPGIEWSIGGGFANVASPTAGGATDYRAWSLSLKARVRR
jgi:hypothetical protein